MKTVFTVGVFDILHYGHIKLLEHAKELGDKLVVAVQDGDYVTRYKPGTEMVNTTEERLFMVKSIRYVDEVTIYEDVDTIVKKINFDILALGEDQNHAGFQRAEQWCKDNGISVVRLHRTPGVSSTQLRKILK